MLAGPHADWQLLALVVALGALLALAPTLRLPVPILLVLGGLVLGFIPGLPRVTLPPDVVLVAFLPPLLYSAAFFTSLKDLRTNVRAISFLALGLVIATTCGVAAVAHEFIAGFSWAAAFTLGAVVAPTDALAVTDIASRPPVPRRLVAIIEGESLVNDGTALVLYKTAVVAAVSGSFSFWHAGGRMRGEHRRPGVAVGLVVGLVIARSAAASTTRRSRSGSRSCRPTSPSCPPTRSASRACSPPSRPASSWAGARRELTSVESGSQATLLGDPGLPPERHAVRARRPPAAGILNGSRAGRRAR